MKYYKEAFLDTDYAPTIRSRLEDIVANVGDLIATLSCEVDGSPTPKIKWFLNHFVQLFPLTLKEILA